MPHADFDTWKAKAQDLGAAKTISVPLHVLIGESVELASFLKEYWEAGDGHSGLKSAGPRISLALGEEILSLRRALQEAQSRYLLAINPAQSHRDLIDRASFVLNEITATIDWQLDDGRSEDADQDLAALKADHEDDSNSADSLAQALYDYASLAKTLKDRIAGLGGFDVALIDEAFDLAEKLGGVGAQPSPNKEATAAKLLRDQMASLLQQKMRLVRAAARFVFRGQPQIARQASSAYERRRRAASRRAAAAPAQG